MSDCRTDAKAHRSVNVGKVDVFTSVSVSKAQALKVLEEASEVVEATKRVISDIEEGERIGMARHEFVTGSRDDLLDEIADVVQASMNLASALGAVDFTGRMQECRKRNERRGRM